jgi:hypothetical protein
LRMRLAFIASYSHLARRLSTFFGARGFRLCENGPTNLLWPTKGGLHRRMLAVSLVAA